jgi:hypothetical protein
MKEGQFNFNTVNDIGFFPMFSEGQAALFSQHAKDKLTAITYLNYDENHGSRYFRGSAIPKIIFLSKRVQLLPTGEFRIMDNFKNK